MMIEADSRASGADMTGGMVHQAERRKINTSGGEPADDTLKIFLVEDHTWFRSQLAAIITADPRLAICGEADNAAEALERIKPASPDLVIVDITLKGMNGLDLIRELRSRSCSACILVLSMHDESMYAERALRAGANGYIAKHETSQQLREAIRRVLSGGVYLSRRMTTELLQKMASADDDDEAAPVARGFASLSPREQEIFQHIGRGLTTREIAKELDLGDKTVHSHRHQIKLKLGVRHGGELYTLAARWLEEQASAQSPDQDPQVGIAPPENLLQDDSVHDESSVRA
jgi:DNA-binding NarL/FixJ family response regulator